MGNFAYSNNQIISNVNNNDDFNYRNMKGEMFKRNIGGGAKEGEGVQQFSQGVLKIVRCFNMSIIAIIARIKMKII